MTPATSTVEATFTASKPTKYKRAATPAVAAAQLATVLAAVVARDELAALDYCPDWPGRGRTTARARTAYQQRLGEVVVAFKSIIRSRVGRCRGFDYCGNAVEQDDLTSAAQVGVMEAVKRYSAERAGGGCVVYVTQWIRWQLQLATGSTRLKRDVVGLEDELREHRVAMVDELWRYDEEKQREGVAALPLCV